MNLIDFIMGSKYFNPKTQTFAKIGLLGYQKRLLKEHYDFLTYKMEGSVLVCSGNISNKDYKNNYKIEIRCVPGKEPHSKIMEPYDIFPSNKIHMYEDHSLCLYYPPDMKWSGWTKIYQYTIPWIIEWITFYELYLINGNIWEGPESPVHFTEEDKNISAD